MNQKTLATYFLNPRKYKKIGTVKARLSIFGEHIFTVVGDKKETENTAKINDVVITGSSDEQYIVSKETFETRYKGPILSLENQTYNSTGFCYAVQWIQEKPAQFVASWGETMIIEPGDMLCSTTAVPNGDLYRIEKNTFIKTYRKI